MTSISCFSYLASVRTLHVRTFPAINYGVDVERVDNFLAGDGPLVAGFLLALGQSATLYSNPVADDGAGREVLSLLSAWGVNHEPSAASVSETRTNTVVVDDLGNRTWFSGLRGIVAELHDLDLAQLTTAPHAYLDCYEVLHDAPRPVLEAALDAGCDIILNLGGSPPPDWLQETTRGRHVGVVQTNADETDPIAASSTLEALYSLGIADLAVVTAGRRGATGRTSRGGTVTVPAIPVDVRQVQGAGSAFSAALIHARLGGADLDQTLQFACAAGSLWCGRTQHGPLPNGEDIVAMMNS
jgi:sugar/nucleoside kinase (ribokinase family)